MIGDPPNEGINSLVIAEDHSLRFEQKEENKLGSGTYGKVYRGTFKGNDVAVKVIVKEHSNDEKKQKREMEEHFRLDHENVLKLLHVEDSRDKTCLLLELCAGTLTDYCEKKYKGPELPPNVIVLYQIANGLHYIHSQNLVNRDVKPDNILISMTTPVKMKLSDFGFVKKTSHRGTFTQSGLKGTLNWMAPEILEHVDESSSELPHGTIQSDTFAAGCVFFYFLTRGKHPFGRSLKVPSNILDNNPIELIEHMQNWQGLYELIGDMIKPKDERISLPDVIKQLTAKLYVSRQFKKVARSLGRGGLEKCVIRGVPRFHPKKPLIACVIEDEIIFFSAENSSISFSNWKEDEIKFQIGHKTKINTMEWNVDGTQLVASAYTEGDIIVCWSYPSGEILFQKENLNVEMAQIKWNPFRPNVFATLGEFQYENQSVFFFNSCPVIFCHFYTMESGNVSSEEIASVQWISETRVALGLSGMRSEYKGIEIWEIDESTTSVQLVKLFQHESMIGSIKDMTWDERTKCLAACSFDGWMTIWSMDNDQPIHATKVDSNCFRLALRPNGKPTDGEGVDAARKSADNFILACGLWDGRIVIWTPLDSKEKTRILSQHCDAVTFPINTFCGVTSLLFSPDGRFLASADWKQNLIIWATENWEPVYVGEEKILRRLRGHYGANIIRAEHFSWLSSSTDVSDYKLFCFISSGGKVVVVECDVGQ